MDGIGDGGDIDIIKAPIVIDNVSTFVSHFITFCALGIWPHESRNRR